MVQVRVFGASQAMSQVADRLQQIPGSRHVIRTPDGARGVALVTAHLADDAVDRTLEQLGRLGVPGRTW